MATEKKKIGVRVKIPLNFYSDPNFFNLAKAN